MSKTIKSVFAVFMAMILVFGAFVVSNAEADVTGGTGDDPSHEHTYRKIVVDPTCTKRATPTIIVHAAMTKKMTTPMRSVITIRRLQQRQLLVLQQVKFFIPAADAMTVM